jgi:hypothetical protein
MVVENVRMFSKLVYVCFYFVNISQWKAFMSLEGRESLFASF